MIMGSVKQSMLEELDREFAKKTAECLRCGEPLNPEEAMASGQMGPPFSCDYCWHMAQKDD